MSAKAAKKATPGTYHKLSKLLANAMDERGNAHFRKESMRLFDKLCLKYGIDPSSIREDGYTFSDQYVLEVPTDSSRFDSFLRVCCLLVGEFWPCEIRGRVPMRGNCVLDFTTQKPNRPDEAARTYRLIKAKLDEGWNRQQEAWKREGQTPSQGHTKFGWLFQASASGLVGGWGGGKRAPHKKSYVSGFFHTMKELLAAEQRQRRLHRRYLEKPEPVAPAAFLPEPEPWTRPPFNPLALAIIIKDRLCCPDAIIPNIKCPKCIEFEKYANRKVQAARRKLAKKEEPPEPVEDAGPSDDPEYESQLKDDLDAKSYMAGQSAASSMDLNELKL